MEVICQKMHLSSILGDVCSLCRCAHALRSPGMDGLHRPILYDMNGYEMDTYELLENIT